MANNQIFPASPYPGAGDIATSPGSPLTTVTGLQHIPVDPATPQPQQLLVMGSDGVWHPEDPVVSGTDAVGTAPSRPPVQVGGTDNVVVRELLLDPQGAVVVSSLSGLGEQIQILIQEIRALKTATIGLDSTLNPADFEAPSYTDQTASDYILP